MWEIPRISASLPGNRNKSQSNYSLYINYNAWKGSGKKYKVSGILLLIILLLWQQNLELNFGLSFVCFLSFLVFRGCEIYSLIKRQNNSLWVAETLGPMWVGWGWVLNSWFLPKGRVSGSKNQRTQKVRRQTVHSHMVHGPNWSQLVLVKSVGKVLQADQCVLCDFPFPGNNTETSGLILFPSLFPSHFSFLSLQSNTSTCPPHYLCYYERKDNKWIFSSGGKDS